MSIGKRSTLPVYTGDTAGCPKCGGVDITTRFCRDCTWSSYELQRAGIRAPGLEYGDEHMHRCCRRCGHEWLEAPLDSAQPAAG